MNKHTYYILNRNNPYWDGSFFTVVLNIKRQLSYDMRNRSLYPTFHNLNYDMDIDPRYTSLNDAQVKNLGLDKINWNL